MPTWKAVQYSTNDNASRSHIANHTWVPGRLYSSLLHNYLLPRRYGPNTSSLCKEECQKPIPYVTIEVQDRPGAASLRYKNSAEITVLMCEKKLCPV